MFKFLILLFANLSFLAAEELPIYVELERESPLVPLYMTEIDADASAFSQDYIRQLQKILKFDLSHNGMTYLASPSSERSSLASLLKFDKATDFSGWMKEKVYFIVQTRIKDKSLGAKLYIVNSNQAKTVDGLLLTGNLSEDRRVVHTLSDMIHKALFQSDGIASTKIIYTLKKDGKKAAAEVFEADYDGANARQVTKTGALSVTPSYIPPRAGRVSRNFLFVSYEIGQPKIYLGDLENGSAKRLTLLKGNQLMPTLSRQRDKIAFISDVTGNPDLFLQTFDAESGLQGKPRQIYATHKATQSTPSFSPDGNKIAFVSNKDGSPRIYVLDIPPPGTPLKETKATLISKANRENSAPNWSPDGTKIAYCSMTQGVRQIWVYDFVTHRERQLTQGPGNKENPSFAPNSLHLVFNSNANGKNELYLVNLNQPEATRITFGEGEKQFPSWEPRNL